ncbi:MAG TPA: glycerol-3-phosphate dehydrogenase/oxidase [Gemmatimonadales bacterium]|nr:glycerol-3-phosphate dehydrogenase/oxidase [Gemmatimonadales bacterium]
MQRDLAALSGTEFDLLVVGGGICGAAIAWDAAQRGLSVAVVERGDFGAATSANSLKIVHGGLRYLQHLDVRRLRESSRERMTLLRIAPHLVQPLPVVVPTFGHGRRGRGVLGAGFALFNALTADRNARVSDPARRIPPARLISRREVVDWDSRLDHPRLTGGGVFWDAQLFNPPRLVWEFLRTAGRAGAVLANYCEAVGFLRRGNRIHGVAVEDRQGGERFEVRARVVVNATGPFAEQLYVKTGLRRDGRIPLSRDLALVIRRPLVHDRALAIQTRYRDPGAVLSRGPRHLFLVPWREVTLVGVNSVIYRGDPNALSVTRQEVQGFLDEINEAQPSLGLGPDDVALVLAGLLPIGADNLVDGNISFGKRPLLVDNATTDGVEQLITVITNRYTVARLVAERAVDLAFRKLGRRSLCRTAEIPLYGSNFDSIADLVHEVVAATRGRLGPEIAECLARNHGSAYGEVLRVGQTSEYGGTLGASQTLKAEAIHAVREEMALKLADCVFRRTGLGTAGDPGAQALHACADLVGGELGWGPDRIASEVAEVRAQFPFWANEEGRGR